MKLVSRGEIKYDCTYHYGVQLKTRTVTYLIAQILKRKNEYGCIYINNKKFEYRYGRLIDSIRGFEGKSIKSISADGGYFLMNYEVITD
ncbi:MAG: hypothetical protein ACRC9P_05725 [Bacteroides sp.]